MTTPNPEVVRLQIDLSYAQRLTADLHEALDVVVDAADHYRRMADMEAQNASVARDQADYALEENQLLGDMNVRLSNRLEDAGLVFEVGGPMDDLRLVDAQLQALTEHRELLLKQQAAQGVLV